MLAVKLSRTLGRTFTSKFGVISNPILVSNQISISRSFATEVAEKVPKEKKPRVRKTSKDSQSKVKEQVKEKTSKAKNVFLDKEKWIVQTVSTKSGIDMNVVEKVLETFIDTVKTSVINDERKISLKKFGVFHLTKKPARTVKLGFLNGKTVTTTAKKSLAFKPSRSTKAIDDKA